MDQQTLSCPSCKKEALFKLPVNVKNTTTRQPCSLCRKVAKIQIQKGRVVGISKG